MNPFRLAASELRRLTASRMARLGVIAIALIPTLYAGLYLYANHDPYAALSQVPAAVASDDRGATLDGGEQLDAGADVADRLVDSKSFDVAPRVERAGAGRRLRRHVLLRGRHPRELLRRPRGHR